MRLSQDSHKIVTASIGDLENSLMNDDTRTRRASKAFRPRRPIAELAAVPSAEMIEIRCRLGPIQDEFYRLLKMWSALVISADLPSSNPAIAAFAIDESGSNLTPGTRAGGRLGVESGHSALTSWLHKRKFGV